MAYDLFHGVLFYPGVHSVLYLPEAFIFRNWPVDDAQFFMELEISFDCRLYPQRFFLQFSETSIRFFV